jgi:hypothetical protein
MITFVFCGLRLLFLFLRERSLKEEERRANAFSERMSSQASFGDLYEREAGKKLKEEAIREEQRILKDIEKKFRSDDERERMKVETRKRELLKSMEVNRQLEDQKRMVKEQERVNDHNRRLKIEADLRAEEGRKQLFLREKMVKQQAIKDQLDAQLAMRMQGKKNESMLTPLEASLNRKLIDKVEKDPSLYMKVLEKVKPGVTRSKTENNIF